MASLEFKEGVIPDSLLNTAVDADVITPISRAEADSYDPAVRHAMAVVAEVLIGTTAKVEDWSDPADPVTWKKPLAEGDR
jgi:hypothetical protein